MSQPVHEMNVQMARPGSLSGLTEAFRREGARLLASRGGTFKGAWTSEFGDLNRLYSLWEFPDEAARAQGQTRLEGAPAWRGHIDGLGALAAGRQQMLLSPARLPGVTAPPGGLYDFRMYDIKPFHVDEYVRLLLDVMPVREKHSRAFGVWRTHAGEVDRIVHLWPYHDLAQRDAVRAAVAAEEGWQVFVKKAYNLLVAQRSSLLRAVVPPLLG
ncbi:MAG: NIPSNAP family protein [Burkholderiaceae bacterium]|nr:NIPSNAP family protein [Burkholderiaceae bacterium]